MTIHNLPFIISKRKDSKYYSVRFKDEKTGKYLPALSTKQTDKEEAIKTAFAWYSSGKISRKDKEQNLKALSILDEIRKTDINNPDIVKMLELLKKRGIIKSYVVTGSQDDVKFTDYLINFWTWGKSEYIQEKLKSGKSVGKSRVLATQLRVKKYWLPFFGEKLLGEITRQDLKEFQTYLQKLEISSDTKNDIWLAGSQAIRYAYNNEIIERDITAGLTGFHGKNKKREILTPEMAHALFLVEWNSIFAKLANILAMCTGLRAGEIRALRKCDLGVNCLYIKHSWSDVEGLKSTKNGEARTVLLPFPQISKKLLELAESNPFDATMNAFIFYATIPGKPIDSDIFIDGLRNALEKIGLTKEDAKKYCFHAWRHFFASYMKDRVSAKLLQSQTGHKTLAMLEHYSEHRIAGDDEQIEAAQISLFGDIVNDVQIDFDEKELYRNVKNNLMDKSGLYEHSRQFR